MGLKIKRVLAEKTAAYIIGIVMIQCIFVLFRYYFLIIGLEENLEAIPVRWRFTIGDMISVLSIVTAANYYVLAVWQGNRLHDRLSQSRLEVITRNNIHQRLLIEFLRTAFAILLSELIVSGIIWVCCAINYGFIEMQWDAYYSYGIMLVIVEVMHLLGLDILLSLLKREAASVVLLFVIMIEIGGSYLDLKFIPLQMIAYDRWVGTELLAGGTDDRFMVLSIELVVVLIVWYIFRLHGDFIAEREK